MKCSSTAEHIACYVSKISLLAPGALLTDRSLDSVFQQWGIVGPQERGASPSNTAACTRQAVLLGLLFNQHDTTTSRVFRKRGFDVLWCLYNPFMWQKLAQPPQLLGMWLQLPFDVTSFMPCQAPPEEEFGWFICRLWVPEGHCLAVQRVSTKPKCSLTNEIMLAETWCVYLHAQKLSELSSVLSWREWSLGPREVTGSHMVWDTRLQSSLHWKNFEC